MKAMILAAGLGTRLRPLTDKMPKAMIEVEGVPMLERIINTLKSQGFDKIVVNIHHFADQIIDFISSKEFGVKIKISDESLLLRDTGGGIVNAYSYLFDEDRSPVLIHNVDILSNANLHKLMDNSLTGSTLLVSDRDSARKLVFDEEFKLKGWHDIKNSKYRWVKEKGKAIELGFSGIYTITESAVSEMKALMPDKSFPIMEYFLHKNRKEPIKGYCQRGLQLIDIGKPASLLQAPNLLRMINSDLN